MKIREQIMSSPMYAKEVSESQKKRSCSRSEDDNQQNMIAISSQSTSSQETPMEVLKSPFQYVKRRKRNETQSTTESVLDEYEDDSNMITFPSDSELTETY